MRDHFRQKQHMHTLQAEIITHEQYTSSNDDLILKRSVYFKILQ